MSQRDDFLFFYPLENTGELRIMCFLKVCNKLFVKHHGHKDHSDSWGGREIGPGDSWRPSVWSVAIPSDWRSYIFKSITTLWDNFPYYFILHVKDLEPKRFRSVRSCHSHARAQRRDRWSQSRIRKSELFTLRNFFIKRTNCWKYSFYIFLWVHLSLFS